MAGFTDPLAIGKVTTAEETFKIQRGDQTIEIGAGDFIYLDDVISAGGTSVGIAFADQTTMSVDPNSTMVIDDFVYDPENPTVGSMNANVLEGNFSFVSGQIAKVGADAMKVTTPVLTIGVRGTQVAGKANTEGEDNEIVLLPNEDGSVGQIMIKNESGEVLLTEAYQATIITDPYTVPTVPVILAKDVVLKKFASTIATTRKTEQVAKVERETEQAVKQKEEAEEEQQELEEEKEKLEEEQEELEEEKEELEEKVEELEEEKEEVAEEKEEIEEKLDEVFEEKEEIEEKKEEVVEEIEQLEEKLEDANVQERQAIEQELEKLEEEFEEIEEEVQEIEKEIEVVVKEKVKVEKKVREIEKEFEQAQDDFSEIEQNIQVIEKEVLQVIEKELVIEKEIKFVEEKFDQIVQEFEVFQEEFVQEFEDFIPEEEIQQFMEEAPIELIEEFQENIIEKLEEEKINVQENENEVARDEDPFAEENVEKKLDELDEKQEELIEKADELMEKDMQLQEEVKELDEKAKELEKEAQQLEKEAEEAYKNDDREAIEEIEQKFEELDEEFKQIDEGFQEIDEQYQEIDEDFQELNKEFISIDEEFQEVFQDGPMVVRIPDDDPGYNTDDDMFMVPEDEQVDVNVEEFIQEEKQKIVENNQFAEEAEDFFQNEEIQEMDIDENVQDMFIMNTGQMDQFIDGAGSGITNADDYHAQEDEMDDIFYVIDNNEELYNIQQEADDWFDQFIADLAEDQNINVAPWLDMPNDTSVSETLSVGTTLGYVYGSDANGDQLTYSILSDASGKIAIDGSRLYLKTAFDNISVDTDYSVLLKVQDPYSASDVDEWIVTVTADPTPVLSSTSVVSMAENASNGATVADINHSGGSGTVTYSITAGNSEGKFSINSSTGVITYNTQASTLTTETFESFSNGGTATGWTGDNGVYETQAWGKTLGKINGNINSTQDVYKTFDFADSYAGKRVAIDFLFWEWGTWDAHNHSPDGGTEQFLVYVNDTLVVQDDRRKDGFGAGDKKYGVETQATGFKPVPVDSAIYGDEEGELYTVYGTLDSSGDIKLGFGMRLGESESNESGAVDNITIRLADLDYEDATSHSLTITATDAGSNTDTVTQTITVTDANEAPRFADYRDAVTVTENGSSGTDIATVFAEDPDSDSITYSITSGDSGNKFTINSSTGLIETAAALDYETATSHTLTITATDEHGLTATTTQTINVGDVNETTQYTKTMDSGTLAAWGALYNQDMNINNAWADSKIAYNYANSNYTGLGGIWGNLEYTISTVSSYDWKTLSQYEQIWDFNYSNTIFSTQQSAMLDYLRTGGQGVGIFEHGGITSNHGRIANFVKLIDSDISSSLSTTDIINGHSSTDGGSGSSGTTTSTTELHTIAAEYNVSDWGTGGEGTETKNQSDTITRGDGVAAAGAWHAENLGSGDLITVQTRAADNTQQGFIAEWDANDSNAEFQGTFVGWGDSNHSYQNNDMRQAYDVVEWLSLQAQGQTHGVSTDNEILPIFGSADGNITVTDQTDDALAVEAYHLGDNVYVGGGYNHIDWAWDDSADTPYWAFNQDLDTTSDLEIDDDHYGVIGVDSDGDGDLWETTDTFDLDKIKILDDSEDYFVQAADYSSPYYFKVTPVTYSGGSWTVETSNTVTFNGTTGYNAYLDLTSNTAFDDINYALIETESALISEVVVTA